MWWHITRLRAAVELDCDRRVLGAGAPVRRYAELLLQLAGQPGPWLLRPTLGRPGAVLGRRILALLEQRGRPRLLQAAGLGAVAVIAVLLACQAEPPQAPSRSASPDPVGSVASGALPLLESRPAPTRAQPESVTVLKSAHELVSSSPRQIRVSCTQSCEVTAVPANREPLFIIDGVVQATRPELAALEGRIEEIGVIKGNAAIERYGDRGRDGVVYIKTKQ